MFVAASRWEQPDMAMTFLIARTHISNMLNPLVMVRYHESVWLLQKQIIYIACTSSTLGRLCCAGENATQNNKNTRSSSQSEL
jgi:hypothetical protein